MDYPISIETLIRLLKRLPGVGARTAERYTFDLLDWSTKERSELQQALAALSLSIKECTVCGGISEQEKCLFCSDSLRRQEIICVVASAKDVFIIENTGEFHGLYHVLPGLLSPLDGRGVSFLQLEKLFHRIQKHHVKEVVLALDSTLEGDTTSLFIKEQFEPTGIVLSRLAFGIPVGSSFDYVDGGTLARAFHGRNRV